MGIDGPQHTRVEQSYTAGDGANPPPLVYVVAVGRRAPPMPRRSAGSPVAAERACHYHNNSVTLRVHATPTT